MKNFLGVIAVGLFLAPLPVMAEDASLSFGGDQYAAGQNTALQAPIERDAFMVGNTISLIGPVKGDAHLGGFEIKVNGAVGGDLYAAGFSIGVNAPVSGDVTAAGNNVTISAGAPVTGNVRLAGASVNISAPVAGAALISAQTLNLDAAVSGDLSFYGEAISFGSNAKVAGTLFIRAPKEIAVPASVAAPEQIRFEALAAPDYVGEASKTAESVVGRFWPMVWGIVAWWLLLFVVGAGFIALLPRAVAAMQTVSTQRPFRKLGLGILALASVLGLVPVVAMTLVGLLLVPFAIVFAVIAWSLACLAGAYFVTLRIWSAFMAVDSNGKRLGVLAVALVACGLSGMIPMLGWFITLGLTIFGFGVISAVLMVRWSAKDAARLGAAAPPAAALLT